MADWRLTSCCGHQQIAFIATVGAFIFVILALWRTPILDPFKLITVFLHEASHATACKLTCGKVEGMEVTADEGGVTHTRGGYQWFILPAGCKTESDQIHNLSTSHFLSEPDCLGPKCVRFCLQDMSKGIIQAKRFLSTADLGSSFWGMVLVISSTNSITLRIAAALLIVSLVVVLIIAKNWFLRFLCLGFITFLIVIWILQETVLKVVRPLRYTILFMGVMNCLFSVYDIYDDLISRRVNTSDAENFANICPCPCNGVGWGVIWGFISFIFLLASVYLGLVILS